MIINVYRGRLSGTRLLVQAERAILNVLTLEKSGSLSAHFALLVKRAG